MMADGERKRKRSRANGDQDRPKKKAAMNGSAALDPSTSIKISHLKARNLCPVVGMIAVGPFSYMKELIL